MQCSSLGPGHKFELQLWPRCHQCLWIRLTAASMWVKVAWLSCRLSRGRQVSHQRWIWGMARRQESMQASPPWLWNPGQMSPEVQNRGISGPTKRTCVLKTKQKKNNARAKVNISFCSLGRGNILWIILFSTSLTLSLSVNGPQILPETTQPPPTQNHLKADFLSGYDCNLEDHLTRSYWFEVNSLSLLYIVTQRRLQNLEQ